MSNELDKGKATITGRFIRLPDDTYNTFLSKVPLSEYSREEIIEKLLNEYNEKGDNIFNILATTAF